MLEEPDERTKLSRWKMKGKAGRWGCVLFFQLTRGLVQLFESRKQGKLLKGRKMTLAQLRVAEEWFEFSITNFHLLCRMGQCDAKFVSERDVQTVSSRWGWEQRWRYLIAEMRVGNGSSKIHTAEVEMLSHRWKKIKQKIVASSVDGVTAGQDTGAPSVVKKGS